MWTTRSEQGWTLVLRNGEPHVRVGPSLAVAGEHGLFAARSFAPKDTIGVYTGQPTSAPGPYVAQIVQKTGRVWLDGRNAGPPFLQKINDARGTPFHNNARLLQSGRIEVTRRLCPGDEILMSYGSCYWKTRRDGK